MSDKKQQNFARRAMRRRRNLRKVAPAGRLRLSVFRSNRQMYAQIFDDASHKTLVAATSLEKELKGKGGGNSEVAKRVGEIIAQRALKKDIRKVFFDCGGYKYHGRVQALAMAAREKGLEF